MYHSPVCVLGSSIKNIVLKVVICEFNKGNANVGAIDYTNKTLKKFCILRESLILPSEE